MIVPEFQLDQVDAVLHDGYWHTLARPGECGLQRITFTVDGVADTDLWLVYRLDGADYTHRVRLSAVSGFSTRNEAPKRA